MTRTLKDIKDLAVKALPVYRGVGEYQILKEPFDRFKEEIQPETVLKLIHRIEHLERMLDKSGVAYAKQDGDLR